MWAGCPAAAGGGSSCTFPAEVTLSETLPCVGAECSIDLPRSLKLVDVKGRPRWYEYVPPPCVRLAFFPNPNTVRRGRVHSRAVHVDGVC